MTKQTDTHQFNDQGICSRCGIFEEYGVNKGYDICDARLETTHTDTDELLVIWKRINRHGRYYDKPMKYTEFVEAVTQYTNSKIADELMRVAVNEEDEIVLCYFTKENPDCSKDVPIEKRIEELQSQTSKEES